MNIPRLLLAILAAFIVVFGTDYLIHAVWLMKDYDATKSLWRPEAEMEARFGWMLFAQFICGATFVLVWALGLFRRSVGAGAALGLLMGVFQQVWAIVNYVVTPMPGELAAKWFLSGIAQAIVLGIVTALIYPARNTAERTV